MATTQGATGSTAYPTNTLAQQLQGMSPQLMQQYGAAMLGGYMPGGPTAQGLTNYANSPPFNTYHPGTVPGSTGGSPARHMSMATHQQAPQVTPPPQQQQQGQQNRQQNSQQMMRALMSRIQQMGQGQGQGQAQQGTPMNRTGQVMPQVQGPPAAGQHMGGGQLPPQIMQALMQMFQGGAGGLQNMTR